MTTKKIQVKDRVASFRINQTVDAEIEARINGKIVGCNTANKFYRKLALDWFNGKIVYTNPEDFMYDPDVLAAMKPTPPKVDPVQPVVDPQPEA